MINLHVGDAETVLKKLQPDSVDCCITSPPYWRKRRYDAGGIGWEDSPECYVNELARVFDALKTVLKPVGSLWINIADTYKKNYSMAGIPWQLASILSDRGWIVRNDVIWNKGPGPDKSTNRLTFCHEHLFHLVKSYPYYYNEAAVRGDPINLDKTKLLTKSLLRIKTNDLMKSDEKTKAEKTLRKMVGSDVNFVMVLKGGRTADGNKRRKQLDRDGFYFMKYNSRGGKFPDVWNISNRTGPNARDSIDHCAGYPEELCHLPISSTCPPKGVVIDPFCGTGTTGVVAKKFKRQFIGIDLSANYIDYSNSRLKGKP